MHGTMNVKKNISKGFHKSSQYQPPWIFVQWERSWWCGMEDR